MEERAEEWETYSDGEHARRNFFCAEHQTIRSRSTWIATCTLSQLAGRSFLRAEHHTIRSRATWIATCTLSQLAARIPALTHAL